MKNDELDAATVERCAQYFDKHPSDLWSGDAVASAIRSLISNSANEIHSSDGGVEGHARGIADSGRASVRGDNGAPESPHPTIAGIKPGPSEAIPSGTFRYGQYDAKVVDPALTQDCAPAGTVSEADICATLCKAHGTAQCAAICMSHSSLHTTDGCCPEAKRVWAHKARALLSQFDVRRK